MSDYIISDPGTGINISSQVLDDPTLGDPAPRILIGAWENYSTWGFQISAPTARRFAAKLVALADEIEATVPAQEVQS